MNTNPQVVLLIVAQLLRALLASSAQTPATAVLVPADNVSIAGLTSDVQMIANNEHSPINLLDGSYIAPADPEGIVVPTTTVTTTPVNRSFIPVGSMYDVFKQPKF